MFSLGYAIIPGICKLLQEVPPKFAQLVASLTKLLWHDFLLVDRSPKYL